MSTRFGSSAVADLPLRLALSAILAGAHVAVAQDVRGVVLDSASRQPLAGASVVLLDAGGRAVGRLATSPNGSFTLRSAVSATRVRVLRLGFRPRELELVSASAGRFEILMAALPTLLEPQRIVAQSKCPRRSDYAASFALWEQAKAGLLAAVIARDALPATMTNLTFKRRVEGNSERVLSQSVRMHQGNAQRSFQAVHTAAEFARLGFVRASEDGDLYLSPDADVLLDDEFMRNYCLSITPGERVRPNEIGLSFQPVARARDHVDIGGTVWIDTAARVLRRIEFKYLGLDSETDRFHPGGQLTFADVRDGIPQIQRWTLRTIEEKGPVVESVVRTNPGGPVDRRRYNVHESGGELARASWSDGIAWRAPLGKLRLHATTVNGALAKGFGLSLDDTDYRASADSAGLLEISDLLPGPYRVSVLDPALAAIDLSIPTTLSFVAARDSVIETNAVFPTAVELIEKACKKDGLWTPNSYLLIVRVVTPEGRPVEGARWSLSVGRSHGTTGSNGVFQYCFGLDVGKVVEINVSRNGELPTTVTRTLAERVTAVRLELPARPK